MKKFASIFLSVSLIIMVNSPALAVRRVPSKTMLEIRNIQTCYHETTSVKKITKSVVDTLQDNGFIIQNIEDELGYIRAKKEVKLKRTEKGRVALYSTGFAYYTTALALSFGLNPSAVYGMYEETIRIKNEIAPHTVIFDSNVIIEPVGNRVKVRFAVIEKVLENADGYTTVKSSPRKVIRHYEPEIYEEFFKQVNKNLFMENNL